MEMGMVMARFEMTSCDIASIGQAAQSADMYYELGIRYSVGNSVEADLIAAHKWFNIAALKGCREAIQLRQEVAASMSPAEIALAQRAARDWLTTH
jgi:TPR repeat protein